MSNSYSPAYQPIETRHLKRSPNCYFYVNGDRKFDPAKVCLSNRIKTLDGVMEELTRFLPQNHRSGGVRSIYTPRQGHRVKDLSQFIDGEYYVAAIGNERFEPIEYREIQQRNPRTLQLTKSGYRKIDINRPIFPVKHPKDPRLREKQGKACAQNEQVRGLRLFVHIYGQEQEPAHKINIGHKQRNRLYLIKQAIADTFSVHEDSPLYKFQYGIQQIEEVREPSDLETNDTVLVINDPYYRVSRGKILDNLYHYTDRGKKNIATKNVTPRNVPYYNYEPFPPPQDNRKRLGKYKPLPSIGSSSKQSGPISPYSNPPSQGGRKNHANRGRPKEINYDEDRGGVYKAKNQDNTRGAREVNDTRDTRVEQPIDQREASEVEEEDFPSKEKTTPIPPGTELNKKPSKEQKQDRDSKRKSEVKKNIKGDSNNKPSVSELPPVVNDDANKNDDKDKRSPVKKERTEDKESQVAEDTFENYKDGKNTPKELKSNNASPSKPPMSTTPPDSTKGKSRQEKISEDANETKRNDQWEDSFEQQDRSNNARRNSTPDSVRLRREQEYRREDFNEAHQKAATRIQAGYRGHTTRKGLEKKRQEKKIQDDMKRQDDMRRQEQSRLDKEIEAKEKAATKIQAGYKGYVVRKTTGQARKQVSDNNDKSEKERNDAAVKIQSRYRGYRTRKYTHKRVKEQSVDINANKNKVDEEKIKRDNTAATKIQSGFRGYKVRKDAKDGHEKRVNEKKKIEAEREAASKKIQASFKGYQVRKNIARMRSEKIEEPTSESQNDVARHQEKAATKIQAGYRGYKARKQVKASRKTDDIKQNEDIAATKIQAAARGYNTRKQNIRNHQEPQLPDSAPQHVNDDSKLNTAATKIQSTFRGYQTRKEIKSKVTCHELESSDLLADDIDQLPESVVSRCSHRKDHNAHRNEKDKQVTNIQMAYKAHFSRKGFLREKSTFSLVDPHTKLGDDLENVDNTPLDSPLSNQEPTLAKLSINVSELLQAAARGFIVRENAKRQIKASSKIQDVYEGDYYATLIQSLCRGYMIRNNLEKPDSAGSVQGPSSPKSSTPKQSLKKSYWADSNIKMYSDKTLRLAATTIQATYFMYKTRVGMQAWKQEQTVHIEQAPYKSDEQAAAAEKIKDHFMKYINRKSKNAKIMNERPKSSASVSSISKRKRIASGKFKYEKSSEIEVRCSTRLSESDTKISPNTNVSSIENDSQSKIISPRSTDNFNEKDYMGGEIEKEGESVKEVEDEEGELSSIQRNVSAVSQLQAAFRAYRLRREISELMSGGGELVDIQKVNRAVSALRRDFTLRSAKVRRLGFEKSKSANKEWLYEVKQQSPSQSINNNNSLIDDNYQRFLDRQKAKEEAVKATSIARIGAALQGHRMRSEKQRRIEKEANVLKIQNAFKVYKSRKSEFVRRKELQKSKSVSILQAALLSYKHRKTELLNKKEEEDKRRRNSETINNAFLAYENRKKEKEERVKKEKLKGGKTLRSAFRKYITRKEAYKDSVRKEELRIIKAKEEAKQKEIKAAKVSTKLQAAFRGHNTRKDASILASKRAQQRAEKAKVSTTLQAAFIGYKLRKDATIQSSARAQQRAKSQASCRSLHVEMHSEILSKRATELQAAFAGHQVRKVFMSLSKLVESNTSSNDTSLPETIQRMGSLSETDDFKLRHKSIAKLQAFNKLHEQNNSLDDYFSSKSNFSTSRKNSMPLIPYRGLSLTSLTRSKTTYTTATVTRNNFVYKSYTQPNLFHTDIDLKKQSKIETYIKQKMAASRIQAGFRGYLTRRRFRQKTVLKKDESRPISGSKRPKSSKSSRVSFNLTPEEEQKAKKQEDLNDQVKQRTTAVKLEAERRKLLAGSLKFRKETEQAKLATASVKVQAVKRREVRVEEENKSAVCIQKAYRGYKVRKALKDNRLQKYEDEYNEWKHKRINAAIAIQSSWRGYTVRKDMKDLEEKLMDEAPVEESEVSSTESSNDLPELIIINIGRTKSEIERAEKRYANANMIQMVVRACKVHRKMQIKMARQRLSHNIAASTIQAMYRGFMTRRNVTINAAATRLQTAVRAHFAREERYQILAEKHRQKRKAACYIQAAYLSRKTRIETEKANELRRQNEASTTIKAGFKGFCVRQEMLERKKDLESTAATKIQAGVKGWRKREKVCIQRKAATLIISAYRSYMQRYQMKLHKARLERERKAADRLHACVRAYNRRQEAVRYIIAEIKRKREESALKIQSVYRGHLGRKIARDRLNAKQMNEDAKYIIDLLINGAFDYIERRSESADRIQACIDGHRTRQRVTTKLRIKMDTRMREKRNNASVIQSMLRTHQGRNRVLKRRIYIAKNAASSKLQAVYRGRVTRREYQERQRRAAKNAAASLVQTVVRVQQARDRLASLKELRLRNSSATKIQALFRGYSVRLDLEREHKHIASLLPPILSPRTRSGRQLTLEVDDILMRNARAMILYHKKATELQGAFRGYLVRKELKRRLAIKSIVDNKTPRKVISSKEDPKEEKSAILIQKTFRGYSDRKTYKTLIKDKRMVWRAASSQIQASVRGYKVRFEERVKQLRLKNESLEDVLREKREAADIISYAYRGWFNKRDRKYRRFEM